MKTLNDLTFEEVDALLSYCLMTGLLRWKVNRSNVKVGSVAGCKRKDGYILIKIKGKLYRAHRIAWLLHHKRWPADEIDHLNGIPSDNRINNLREVTRTGNCRNQKKRSDNTSGYTGVHKFKDPNRKKPFMARLEVNGKTIFKCFETLPEAIVWRMEQDRKYGFTPGHGLEQDQREQLHKFVRRAGK